jgi:hypothetical protein
MNSENETEEEWKPNVLILGPNSSDYYSIGGLLRIYNNFLLNLDSIICCSASCVIGMMLCLGYSALEIVELTEGENYLGESRNGVQHIISLISKGHQQNIIYKNKLKELIIKKIGHDGTLFELYNACGIELICVLTLKDQIEPEYVSYKNYPDELISNIVYSSLSFPIFYEEQRLNDRVVVNGSFSDPLPVGLKDDGTNRVLVLYSMHDVYPIDSPLVKDLQSIVSLSIKSLMKRSIKNASKKCKLINFKYELTDDKNEMIKNGYKQMSDFLSSL